MTARHPCSRLVVSACLLIAPPVLGQQAVSASPTQEPQANAEPTRAQCVDAHTQAQVHRKESALLEASELLKICSSRSCPDVIQNDCTQWTTEIEQQIPSIVIDARVGQQPAGSIRVFVDNQPVPALDAGRAAPINPGHHVVRVEVPAHEPKEVAVIVYEGQRYQPVHFDFSTSSEPQKVSSSPASQPANTQPSGGNVTRSRPVPMLTWVLGGAGVLGVGGFALFGAWGQSKQHDLDGQCSPNCTKDSVDSVRQKYRIADVSLAIGAAALVGAGVVYLTRPTKEQVVALTVVPTQNGGGLYLQWNHF